MSKQITVKDLQEDREFKASKTAWDQTYSTITLRDSDKPRYQIVGGSSKKAKNVEGNAEEAIAKIKESEDTGFLSDALGDSRKTVKEAAQARIDELGNGDGE